MNFDIFINKFNKFVKWFFILATIYATLHIGRFWGNQEYINIKEASKLEIVQELNEVPINEIFYINQIKLIKLK